MSDSVPKTDHHNVKRDAAAMHHMRNTVCFEKKMKYVKLLY